jgi:molybdopterin synthase catalytic subunit
MRVRVLFFGVLKELAGKPCDTLDLPEDARVRDLLSSLESKIPRMKDAMASLAVAVNQQYAAAERELKSDDEVALLPPVSGGSGKAEDKIALSPGCYVTIQRDAIDSTGILVRNETRGRKTLYLDYEAYEKMALEQMEGLVAQAIKQFPIRCIALIHRLGRLEIGETSVLIVVASAHRAAAFDACRWLIDTLKRTVPIWKKEHFEDGAVWADGEPFPAEIQR